MADAMTEEQLRLDKLRYLLMNPGVRHVHDSGETIMRVDAVREVFSRIRRLREANAKWGETVATLEQELHEVQAELAKRDIQTYND